MMRRRMLRVLLGDVGSRNSRGERQSGDVKYRL